MKGIIKNYLDAQSASIRTTGHERANFTVVLTWDKTPPAYIFKIKKIFHEARSYYSSKPKRMDERK